MLFAGAGVPCIALHHLPVLCPPLRGSCNIKPKKAIEVKIKHLGFKSKIAL